MVIGYLFPGYYRPHFFVHVDVSNILFCRRKVITIYFLFLDCLEAYKSGKTKKGIYKIKPKGAADGFMGFCDEGWTVIQRRFDGHTSFERYTFFILI